MEGRRGRSDRGGISLIAEFGSMNYTHQPHKWSCGVYGEKISWKVKIVNSRNPQRDCNNWQSGLRHQSNLEPFVSVYQQFHSLKSQELYELSCEVIKTSVAKRLRLGSNPKISAMSLLEISDTVEDSSAATTTEVKCALKLCMVCEEAPMQYKCPRCDYLTCSLQCCKQHKAEVSMASGNRHLIFWILFNGGLLSNEVLNNNLLFVDSMHWEKG